MKATIQSIQRGGVLLLLAVAATAFVCARTLTSLLQGNRFHRQAA
jgi:hypothetical protein